MTGEPAKMDLKQRTKDLEQELLFQKQRQEELLEERTAELREANERLRREMEERRQVEESLRRSEDRYRLISELSSDFAFSTHFLPDGGYKLDWETPLLSSVTGYTQPELIAIGGLESVVLPDSIDAYKQRRELILAGRPAECELHIKTKGGVERWLYLKSRPVGDERDKNNVHVITVGRDITEQKRMEESLKKSEAKYRLLAENATDVIWTLDMNLRITYISPSANRLRDRTGAEYMAASPEDYLPPASIETMARIIREEIAVEKDLASKGLQTKDLTRPRVFDLEFKRKGGGTFWTEVILDFIRDDNGKPVGILGVSRDIGDRKRTEKALQESENRYRLISELSSDFAYSYKVLSDESLSVDWQTPHLSSITGYQEHEIAARGGLASIVLPDSIDAYSQRRKQILAGQPDECELHVKTRGGAERWLYLKSRPVWDESEGNTLHVITVGREITEQKRMEESLRRSEAKYRLLAENATDVIWTMDMDRRVTYISPSVNRYGDRKDSEYMASSIVDYLTPSSVEVANRVFQEELAIEEELASQGPQTKNLTRPRAFELEFQRKNGGTFWTEIITDFIRDEDGEPIGILGVSRDIGDRKKAEEALRESENRYRLISELSSDFAYSIRLLPDSGHIHEWETKALSSITGYPESELTARGGLKSILMPDSIESYLRRGKAIREGKPYEGEFHIKTRDGKERWIFISSHPVWYGSEDKTLHSVTIGRDITEKKRMEESLRQSEAKYRFLAENISDVIWTMDSNFELTYISPSVNRYGGRTDEEFLRCGFLKYLTPESLQNTAGILVEEAAIEKDLAAKGMQRKDLSRPRTFEQEIMRRDGGTVITEAVVDFIRDDDGKPIGIMGVNRDITDRKKAEEALKESELLYRTLFEGAPVGIGLADWSGQFIAANDYLFQISGYPPEELNMEHYDALFQDREQLRILTNMMRGNDNIRNFEVGLKRKDGTPYWASLTVTPVTIGGEDLFFTVAIDITEHKRMEEEKRKLETQLQRARKMEAIGTLAGGVAHDLNNILGGIVGYPELLALRLPPDSQLKKPLQTIQRSGEKAAAIVQDLLTLARRGVMVSEVVNLNEILTGYLESPECARLMALYPNINLSVEIEADLFNVLGSPVHLSKTVMNLISNAVEAIGDEGQVIISTANQYVDRPMRGYDRVAEGDYVVLSVADNGIGISKDDLEHIFEPFYTKKVMGRSGTGLGMAVVWGAVKDHQGYIDIRSETGKGSTFRIFLPVTRKEAAREKQEKDIRGYTGQGESILVVDDVEEQREIASGILRELGYSVTAVSSGEEAIEFFNHNSADLLILDMIMDPGIDGLETFKRIVELHPTQKAVIASGYSETDRVREAQRLGAGAYLKKPYTLEKIGAAVRDHLDGR